MVTSADGTNVRIDFQTIHLHARVADAKYVAEQIRQMVPDARPLTSEPFSVDEHEPELEHHRLAYSE
jgi:hypothetical protein